MQQKIKVAFFLPSLECGGAERNTINLLKALDRRICAPELILAEKKGDFLKDVPFDVPVKNLNTPILLSIFFQLIRYLRQSEAHVFVSAFPRFNAMVLLAKKCAGGTTKIVITEHLSFSLLSKNAKTAWHRFVAKFFFPYFIKFFYPTADKLVCVSQGIADEICAIADNGKNIQVIYNPVAESKILELAQEQVNHEWFRELEIPMLVMVGRLSKTKDQPTLFKALSILIKKRPLRLVIVGDGSEREKLEKLTDTLNITDNVLFVGFQDNPYKYMKRASVFVLSSLQEGFANVIVEAMMCGAPVVATNCDFGPAEIIQEGINGLLVPSQNEKAMADAISKILDNPELAEKLSIEGKRRADVFSVTKSVQEYEKVFSSLATNEDTN